MRGTTTPWRFVVALIAGMLVSGASVAENRDAIAVIIGNTNYGASLPSVDFAANDADPSEGGRHRRGA